MKTYFKPSLRTLDLLSDALMEGTSDPNQKLSAGSGTGDRTRGFWDWDYDEKEEE